MSAPLKLDLPPSQRLAIAALVDIGLFGSTPQEVVSYLILRSLDDLMRDGVLLVPRPEA